MPGFFLILQRYALSSVVVPVFLLLSGCDQGPTAAPVDADEARSTLTTALDAWAAGKSPADLRSGSPEIVVQDVDWERGMKLTKYEVVGTGDQRDANLECPTELTLVDPEGKTLTKTVTYIVGTDPVLTVFRKVEM